jgi:predicted RNase H-like HicB family nuclease
MAEILRARLSPGSIDEAGLRDSIRAMAMLLYSIHIEPIPQGGFYVIVPVIPECRTTAKSFDLCLSKIRHLIEKHLSSLAKAGRLIPTEQQKVRPLCLPVQVKLPQGAKTILASKLFLPS